MATAAISTRPSAAREVVADVIAAQGPGYYNLAENVRSGGSPNMWIGIAIAAAEAGMRFIPADAE